jgi:DNA-binding CsgD family transcriptional regulator
LLGDRQGDGDDEVARVAVLRAFSLFWGLGRSDEAVDGLAEAATRITEISHRTWVEAVRSGLLTLTGRSPEGVAVARPLVERTGLSARTEMTALSALAMGLALTGRPEEAINVAEGCLTGDPLAEGDSLAPMWTTHSLFLAYRISGRLGELEALASDQYRLALQLNNRSGQGAAAAALGWVALPRGELSQAVAYFREAASLLERVDPTGLRIPALGALAETLAITGDVEGAVAAHAEAVGRPAGRPAGADGDGEEAHHRLIMSAAWIIAARGEVSRALNLLDRIAAEAASSGQVSLEIMALSAMTRLGSPHLKRRVANLAGRVEGPLVQAIAAHASALADVSGASGAAELLDEVTERYAGMTFNLYAAEAAAQASRAHGLAGNARKAAASAARAHFLLAAHDGPRPLGLSVALTPPGLTRREREVALLAVRGLSSQTIADTLCVSVRTVDTHLTRVYYKLGISGRGQLAGALAVDPTAVAASAKAVYPALPDEPDPVEAAEG